MEEALETLRDMGLMWRSRWLTCIDDGEEKPIYGGIEFLSLDPDMEKLQEVQDFYDYNEIRFDVQQHFDERIKFTAGQ